MHRSGTTLVTEVLQRSGVLMGRDATAYSESNFFQRCNVNLMKSANADWDKPVRTNAAPTGFNMRHWLTEYASLLKHPIGWWPLLRRRGWGWKDPRSTYTLGSWIGVFPKLAALHVYRNGLDVARSLYTRNAMLQPGTNWHSPLLNDLKTCFDLWEAYTQQAQSWKQVLGDRYLAVRYEDLVAQRDETVDKLNSFIGRDVSAALQHLVDKERLRKEPMPEMQELRRYAQTNQTLLRLGYAVD
jgi:hypothetical protein